MKATDKTAETSRWHYSLYCAIAILFMTGCEKEDSNPIEDNRILVQASINGPQSQTKVTEPTPEGKSRFEENDEIGVFVIDNIASGGMESDGVLEPTGNHADNVKHILSDGKWKNEGTNDMLWTNNQSLYLIAYYPHQTTLTDGVTDMTKVPFQVKANQSVKESGAARTNYQLSDLLWARSANTKKGTGSATTPIELKFNHALSKATINLKFNDEFKDPATDTITVPSTITVSVVGTNTKALVNFRSAIKASPSYKPDPNWEDNEDAMTAEKGIAIADVKAPSYDAITPASVTTASTGYHKTFQAIVVPQTILNNTLITIKATINGADKVYNYTPSEFEFKSGLHHIFNITVGSYGLTVSTSTTDAINDWGTGEVTAGDTEKASLFNGNYWATGNLGITDANKLGTLYAWSASLCPAGYRLPTESEYAAILPAISLSFTPAKSSTPENDEYYADGSTTIYGIKKAADNTRYWICWQYLKTTTVPADKYLKISRWTDSVADGISLPTTGSDAEKLLAIKAMLPKSQAQTLILPAASSSGTEGDYWTATKDKYISFNATTITPSNTVSAGDTGKTCSARCIQKQ